MPQLAKSTVPPSSTFGRRGTSRAPSSLIQIINSSIIIITFALLASVASASNVHTPVAFVESDPSVPVTVENVTLRNSTLDGSFGIHIRAASCRVVLRDIVIDVRLADAASADFAGIFVEEPSPAGCAHLQLAVDNVTVMVAASSSAADQHALRALHIRGRFDAATIGIMDSTFEARDVHAEAVSSGRHAFGTVDGVALSATASSVSAAWQVNVTGTTVTADGPSNSTRAVCLPRDVRFADGSSFGFDRSNLSAVVQRPRTRGQLGSHAGAVVFSGGYEADGAVTMSFTHSAVVGVNSSVLRLPSPTVASARLDLSMVSTKVTCRFALPADSEQELVVASLADDTPGAADGASLSLWMDDTDVTIDSETPPQRTRVTGIALPHAVAVTMRRVTMHVTDISDFRGIVTAGERGASSVQLREVSRLTMHVLLPSNDSEPLPPAVADDGVMRPTASAIDITLRDGGSAELALTSLDVRWWHGVTAPVNFTAVRVGHLPSAVPTMVNVSIVDSAVDYQAYESIVQQHPLSMAALDVQQVTELRLRRNNFGVLGDPCFGYAAVVRASKPATTTSATWVFTDNLFSVVSHGSAIVLELSDAQSPALATALSTDTAVDVSIRNNSAAAVLLEGDPSRVELGTDRTSVVMWTGRTRRTNASLTMDTNAFFISHRPVKFSHPTEHAAAEVALVRIGLPEGATATTDVKLLDAPAKQWVGTVEAESVAFVQRSYIKGYTLPSTAYNRTLADSEWDTLYSVRGLARDSVSLVRFASPAAASSSVGHVSLTVAGLAGHVNFVNTSQTQAQLRFASCIDLSTGLSGTVASLVIDVRDVNCKVAQGSIDSSVGTQISAITLPRSLTATSLTITNSWFDALGYMRYYEDDEVGRSTVTFVDVPAATALERVSISGTTFRTSRTSSFISGVGSSNTKYLMAVSNVTVLRVGPLAMSSTASAFVQFTDSSLMLSGRDTVQGVALELPATGKFGAFSFTNNSINIGAHRCDTAVVSLPVAAVEEVAVERNRAFHVGDRASPDIPIRPGNMTHPTLKLLSLTDASSTAISASRRLHVRENTVVLEHVTTDVALLSGGLRLQSTSTPSESSSVAVSHNTLMANFEGDRAPIMWYDESEAHSASELPSVAIWAGATVEFAAGHSAQLDVSGNTVDVTTTQNFRIQSVSAVSFDEIRLSADTAVTARDLALTVHGDVRHVAAFSSDRFVLTGRCSPSGSASACAVSHHATDEAIATATGQLLDEQGYPRSSWLGGDSHPRRSRAPTLAAASIALLRQTHGSPDLNTSRLSCDAIPEESAFYQTDWAVNHTVTDSCLPVLAGAIASSVVSLHNVTVYNDPFTRDINNGNWTTDSVDASRYAAVHLGTVSVSHCASVHVSAARMLVNRTAFGRPTERIGAVSLDARSVELAHNSSLVVAASRVGMMVPPNPFGNQGDSGSSVLATVTILDFAPTYRSARNASSSSPASSVVDQIRLSGDSHIRVVDSAIDAELRSDLVAAVAFGRLPNITEGVTPDDFAATRNMTVELTGGSTLLAARNCIKSDWGVAANVFLSPWSTLSMSGDSVLMHAQVVVTAGRASTAAVFSTDASGLVARGAAIVVADSAAGGVTTVERSTTDASIVRPPTTVMHGAVVDPTSSDLHVAVVDSAMDSAGGANLRGVVVGICAPCFRGSASSSVLSSAASSFFVERCNMTFRGGIGTPALVGSPTASVAFTATLLRNNRLSTQFRSVGVLMHIATPVHRFDPAAPTVTPTLIVEHNEVDLNAATIDVERPAFVQIRADPSSLQFAALDVQIRHNKAVGNEGNTSMDATTMANVATDISSFVELDGGDAFRSPPLPGAAPRFSLHVSNNTVQTLPVNHLLRVRNAALQVPQRIDITNNTLDVAPIAMVDRSAAAYTFEQALVVAPASASAVVVSASHNRVLMHALQRITASVVSCKQCIVDGRAVLVHDEHHESRFLPDLFSLRVAAVVDLVEDTLAGSIPVTPLTYAGRAPTAMARFDFEDVAVTTSTATGKPTHLYAAFKREAPNFGPLESAAVGLELHLRGIVLSGLRGGPLARPLRVEGVPGLISESTVVECPRWRASRSPTSDPFQAWRDLGSNVLLKPESPTGATVLACSGSATVSVTQTLPLTATATIPVEEEDPYVLLPHAAIAAAQATQTIAVVASALAGSPVTATQASRSMALLRLSRCEPPIGTPLDWPSSPTGATLTDSKDVKHHVGAVIMNYMIIIVWAAANLVAGLAYARYRRLPNTSGAEWARFPSASVFPCMFLLQALSTSSIATFTHSIDAKIAVGVFGFLGVLGMLGGATAFLTVFLDRFARFEPRTDDANDQQQTDGAAVKPASRRLGQLFISRTGDWANRGTTACDKMFGVLYDDYNAAAPYFITVEMATSITLGLCVAVTDVSGCDYASYAVFLILAGYVASIVTLRPFARVADVGLTLTLAVVQTLVALLTMVKRSGVDAEVLTNVIEILVLVAMGLMAVRAIFDVGLAIRRQIAGRAPAMSVAMGDSFGDKSPERDAPIEQKPPEPVPEPEPEPALPEQEEEEDEYYEEEEDVEEDEEEDDDVFDRPPADTKPKGVDYGVRLPSLFYTDGPSAYEEGARPILDISLGQRARSNDNDAGDADGDGAAVANPKGNDLVDDLDAFLGEASPSPAAGKLNSDVLDLL